MSDKNHSYHKNSAYNYKFFDPKCFWGLKHKNVDKVCTNSEGVIGKNQKVKSAKILVTSATGHQSEILVIRRGGVGVRGSIW